MVVFVGDKPSSKNADPRVPFVGTKSYSRLLEWIDKMGIDISCIALANKDDFFIATQKMVVFETKTMKYRLCKNDKVVALGLAASKSLDSLGVGHFTLPHPSGLNRQLNNNKFVEQKLQECMRWLDAYSNG